MNYNELLLRVIWMTAMLGALGACFFCGSFYVRVNKSSNKLRERFFGPLFFKQKKEDPNSEKMIDDNHLYCSECVKLSTHNTIEDHKVYLKNKKLFRYSKSTSSGNFKAHMDTKHPNLVQSNTPASASNKQLSSYFASFVKPTCSSKKKRKSSDEEVAVDAYLMIARDNLPLQTVGNEGLNTFLCKYTTLEQSESSGGFKTVLPSRRTVTRAGEKVYSELKSLLKSLLKEDGHLGAAATFDIWTDRYAKSAYCGITYHFIDDCFYLKRVLLDASKFGDRHTAENIGVYVEGIMNEYGCDSKIKMYVTDAASNNKKWGNDKEKPRMNCDAHSLHHLITTDSVKKVKDLHDVVKKAKKIVYALTWRKKDLEDVGILATVAEVTEEMELDEQFGTGDLTLVFDSPQSASFATTLKQECPTRWTSLWSLLTSVLKNMDSIKVVLDKMDRFDLMLSKTEISMLKEYLRFLDDFKRSTMEMQGDNYVTLSTAVLVREELYLAIQDKEGDSAILKQVKKLMRGKWDDRLPSLLIHYLTSILDPSLKDLRSLEDYLKQEYRGQAPPSACESLLREYAAMMDIDVDARSSSPPPEVRLEVETLSTPEVTAESSLNTGQKRRLELLKKVGAKRPATNGALDHELVNYLSIRLSDQELATFDVLDFWRHNQKQYPLLAKLARALFYIPATAAPIERVWSEGGLIITAKRSRLSANNFRNLIFTNCNFKYFKDCVKF